jgi:murein L,D-transpeptidase YcbB/YkuD
VLLLLGVGANTAAASPASVEDALRERVRHVREGGTIGADNGRIEAAEFVAAFYEQTGYQPAWSRAENVDALIAAVRGAGDHGLRPGDFNLERIIRMRERLVRGGLRDRTLQAELDILLTDSLVRLGHQLWYGKVDPLSIEVGWNFSRPLVDNDPIAAVADALTAGEVGTLLRSLELDHPYYERLKGALKRFRQIRANGGWPGTPEEGERLEPGVVDPRVVVLRQRLRVTGELPATAPTDNPTFDDAVVQAVKQFQVGHGLAADGVVGRRTLAALNVSVEERIDQIRVNLERSRWVLRDLDHDFLVVNIAGFRTYLVRNGEEVWSARVIVGRPARRTPLFTAPMTYVVFNPSWTVPPTILREDLLPKLRQDPGYLQRNGFRLVDREGSTVDPGSVDFAATGMAAFPHKIVQVPGRKNALGRVKFMFPNPHSIYLHDTPEQRLFERSERTFSSGCIRVEKPLELAALVLASDPAWTPAAVAEAANGTKTRRVVLSKPLPVLILYWTVEADADGAVRFINDVYGRDRPVLAKLGREAARPPE